jgi:hypothetical protein
MPYGRVFVRLRRCISALLRLAMVAVFATMSLGHRPVMLFAHGQSNHVQASHVPTGGHFHHHQNAAAIESTVQDSVLDVLDDECAGDHHAPVSPIPVGANVCYAVGCFASLAAPAAGSPTAGLLTLGRLVPKDAPDMTSALVKPAVPPPRLPV